MDRASRTLLTVSRGCSERKGRVHLEAERWMTSSSPVPESARVGLPQQEPGALPAQLLLAESTHESADVPLEQEADAAVQHDREPRLAVRRHGHGGALPE